MSTISTPIRLWFKFVICRADEYYEYGYYDPSCKLMPAAYYHDNNWEIQFITQPFSFNLSS